MENPLTIQDLILSSGELAGALDVRQLILSDNELATVKTKRRAKREVTINLPEYTVTHPDDNPHNFEIRKVQGKTSDWSLICVPDKLLMKLVDNRGKKPTRYLIDGETPTNADIVHDMTPIISRMPDSIETGCEWFPELKKDLEWRRACLEILHKYPKFMKLLAANNTDVNSILYFDSWNKSWSMRVRRWGCLGDLVDPEKIYSYLKDSTPWVERHKSIRGTLTEDEISYVTSMSSVLELLSKYIGPLASMYMAELCHVTFDVQTRPNTQGGLVGSYNPTTSRFSHVERKDDLDVLKEALDTLVEHGINLSAADILDYVIGSMIRQGFDTEPFAFFCAWAADIKAQWLSYGEIVDERPQMLISHTAHLKTSLREHLTWVYQKNVKKLHDDALGGSARVSSWRNNTNYTYSARAISDLDTIATIAHSGPSWADKITLDNVLSGSGICMEIKYTPDDGRDGDIYAYAAVEVDPNTHQNIITQILTVGQGKNPWHIGQTLESSGVQGNDREFIERLLKIATQQIFENA